MMNYLQFDMHRGDESFISLAEVLSVLPDPPRIWKLFDIWATSLVPNAGGPDLEEHVRTLPEGLELKWSELLALASQFDQTVDCRLIAPRRPSFVRPPDGGPGESEDYVWALIADDSSFWEIYAKSQNIEELMSGIGPLRATNITRRGV